MELYAKKKHSCKPLKQSFIQFCYHLASTLVYARKADAFHLIIFHGCANYQSQTTTRLMKHTIVFQLVKTKDIFDSTSVTTYDDSFKMFSIDQKLFMM